VNSNVIPFTETTPLRRLLTEEQLAGILRVTDRHIRNLRSRNLIPFVRLGRTIRYDPDHVQAVIEKNLTVRERQVGA
jgi:excisionase family DNA binding protein